MENEIKESHESFGMLGFYRSSVTSANLFGSSIKHQHTIRMTLKKAEKGRSLNRDWYSGRGEIVEVEMSQNQFAEMITSMNVGDGVPVTIRRLNGKTMEPCPEENRRQEFEKEFELKIKKLNNIMKSLFY